MSLQSFKKSLSRNEMMLVLDLQKMSMTKKTCLIERLIKQMRTKISRRIWWMNWMRSLQRLMGSYKLKKMPSWTVLRRNLFRGNKEEPNWLISLVKFKIWNIMNKLKVERLWIRLKTKSSKRLMILKMNFTKKKCRARLRLMLKLQQLSERSWLTLRIDSREERTLKTSKNY